MKYYLFLLLFPLVANATMSAKLAAKKTQDLKDENFLASVDYTIQTGIATGQCAGDRISSSNVSKKVVDKKLKELSKLGYRVRVEADGDIFIDWCKY